MEAQEGTEESRPAPAEWLRRLREHLSQGAATAPPPHYASLKRASILVLLDKDGNVLLNQRSLDLKSHPGEICFPGGKQDEADGGDDVVTALRECHEEVGLEFQDPRETKNNKAKADQSESSPSPPSSSPLPKLEILGSMPAIESLHHLCVTPIVAFLPDHHHSELTLTLNEREVSAAFWAPLDFFVTNTPIELYPIEWAGYTFWYRNYSYNIHSNEHGGPGNSSSSNNNNKNNKRRRRPSRPQAVNITGLTAHVVYDVSKIAHPLPSNSFVLLRQCQRGSAVYWTPKCFDFASSMLHQYDHEYQRHNKQHVANKKNRLKLDGSCRMEDYVDMDAYANAFQLIALDGQVTWTLAAMTKKDKEVFQKALLQNMESNNKADSSPEKQEQIKS